MLLSAVQKGKVGITSHSLDPFRFFTTQIITQTVVLETQTETLDFLSPSSFIFAAKEPTMIIHVKVLS